MDKKPQITWLPEPETHNYPAAESYLSLLFKGDVAKQFVAELQKANITSFKAKDIFRSSSLSLLGISNYHVKKDTHKIQVGVKLSPILLVRDSANGKVIVADGYHRLCAVYSFDEDAIVPCKIV